MKTYVFYLIVLVAATPLIAADSEVEQLRAEVQALRQIVKQLTMRVQNLEGKTQATLRPSNEQSVQETPKTTRKIGVDRYTPNMRRLGKHAYYIEHADIEQASSRGKEINQLVIDYRLQNFDTEMWVGHELPTLQTTSGKIIKGTTSMSLYTTLVQGMKKRIKVKFTLPNDTREDLILVFEEKNQRGKAEFRIKLR